MKTIVAFEKKNSNIKQKDIRDESGNDVCEKCLCVNECCVYMLF